MSRDKELYQQLRAMPWQELWSREAARFNSAGANERLEQVAVVRAVGVVFSESGPHEDAEAVKIWLHNLLVDPAEKIRRYAMAALPKIGTDMRDEKALLALAQKSASERERRYASEALAKIGGKETLRHAFALPAKTVQRVKASLLRAENPSRIRLDAKLSDVHGFEIHLRGRAGLEQIAREEAEAQIRSHGKFRILRAETGRVTLVPTAQFSLADIYVMRCFGTVAFVLGQTNNHDLESLAQLATSPPARKIFEAFTDGPIRYRLDFTNKGHQRAAVRTLAHQTDSLWPNIVNGGGDTPWTIEIHSLQRGARVELCPKTTPDPRFAYQQRDVPAASHPPLAACMARLAGRVEGAVVWDPFCGSGLELIERCLFGGVKNAIGTDRSADAIKITRDNFAAAQIDGAETNFVCADFRDFEPGKVSLIITNPPMGKRVAIPDLRKLIEDLFRVAARSLVPGGRLVFVNPLKLTPRDRSLKLQFAHIIDMGGFKCRLEKYEKTK